MRRSDGLTGLSDFYGNLLLLEVRVYRMKETSLFTEIPLLKGQISVKEIKTFQYKHICLIFLVKYMQSAS